MLKQLLNSFKAFREQAVCTEAFFHPLDLAASGKEEGCRDERAMQAALTVSLDALDSPDLQVGDLSPPGPPDPQSTVLRDKLGFFLGVVNVVFSSYWLGQSPETWCNWYTAKAGVLFSVRYVLYKRRKWNYYLFEFCYFANMLLLLEIWVFPQSHRLHKVVFALCAGPITFSIPALRNSLVLHSLDKTTSLFMHLSPAVTAWCLRWHPHRDMHRNPQSSTFSLEHKGPSSFDQAKWWELTLLPMAAYLFWAVAYYLKMFVLSSEKIQRESYSNMYTLMVTNSKAPPARLVLKAPPKLRPLVYMLLHCFLCSLAVLAAVVFWHSKVLHTVFLVLCSAASAWNGATFFFDVFAFRTDSSLQKKE